MKFSFTALAVLALASFAAAAPIPEANAEVKRGTINFSTGGFKRGDFIGEAGWKRGSESYASGGFKRGSDNPSLTPSGWKRGQLNPPMAGWKREAEQ